MLLLLASFTVFNLILILRFLSRRGGKPRTSAQQEVEVEPEADVTPPEEIVQEIHPITLEAGEVSGFVPPPEEPEVQADIRPVIAEETSDACPYCPIFSDLGTAVCPNCGRPLSLRKRRRD